MRAFVLFSFFSLLSFARAQTPLYQQLMGSLGVEQQLQQVNTQMISGLEPYKSKMDAGSYEILSRVLLRNFEGKWLLRLYGERFSQGMSEENLKAALSFFATPVGKKISEAQRSRPPIEKAKSKIQVSETRRKLVAVANEALQLPGVYIDITVNVARGVLRGMIDSGRAEPDFDDAKLRKHLKNLRKTMRPQIIKALIDVNLIAFRNISDVELGEYIRFLKTPPGRSVAEASLVALNDALAEAARSAGRTIVMEFEKTHGAN